ncbi:MAG: ketopantoate reductase family protein [Roseiarcus sp.]
MRLLVVGAGSTGGYFGGRLAQAGRDVTFLVRPARAAKLKETGLRIVSPYGDATLQPKVVTTETLAGTYDAVLLTVKAYQLEAAMEDFAPAVGPESMILPVLNGMGHMDLLARRFSPHNVVGCALQVSTTLDDDGRVVQLSTLQNIVYGELDGELTPRIASLDEFMRSAEIGARLSPAIQREMWGKWTFLASLAATTCLMRGSIGEVEACPGGAAFTLQLFGEVAAIVAAVGVPPSDGFLTGVRAMLTEKGSPLAASMFRDLQSGRPIEAEAIVGDLIRRGAKAGIGAPLLSAAYVCLVVHQNKLGMAH